jgi:glucokinase
MYTIGIEIGGTKLQVGVGPSDGTLAGLWRETVDVAAGPEGIRRQIQRAIPELLQKAGIRRDQVQGVGIGFGGPVDDATHCIIKSHQIDGWDNFPLAKWISEIAELPAVLSNDADCAGLAEALYGAGKGLSPIFYITIGSGIGGGLIINGEIFRGVGRGAAEFGHLRVANPTPKGLSYTILEKRASGWGIEKQARVLSICDPQSKRVVELASGDSQQIQMMHIARAAQEGDPFALDLLNQAIDALAEGICHVITLICPRRIVIGGGVSLIGEKLLFDPLRHLVAQRVFQPFAGLTDIVPAQLGEQVVVHGAIALANKKLLK